MLKKVFDYIDETPITPIGWIVAITGITLVRNLLENFVNPNTEGIFTTNIQVFLHFTLFYFSIILAVIIVVHLFSKRDIFSIAKAFMFGLLIILIPPIIDTIVTLGEGVQLGYLIIHPDIFLSSFFTFAIFGLPNLSVGIRVGFALMMLMVFIYVKYYSGSTYRSIGAVFVFYCIFFLFYTLPSYFGFNSSYLWLNQILNSLVGQNAFNSNMTSFTSFDKALQTYLDIAISHIYYIMISIGAFLVFYLGNAQKFVVVITNSRPERVLHYFAMIVIGIFIAFKQNLVTVHISTWSDITSIFILFFSFYCAWMYAVINNDIADIKTDQISNTTRPLVTGEIEESNYKEFGIIFLIFSIVGGYLVGHYALYMVLIFIAISHIYSMPPLRLKKFLVLNTFLIALASLSAVLAGFYTFSNDFRIDAFPLKLVILIVIAYTFFANIKDVKDIEGDRANKIYTIPVVFGLRNGKKIITLLLVAVLILIPLMTGIDSLWYPILPFTVAIYYLLNVAPFSEIKLFLLYHLYLVSLGIIVLFN